MSVSRNLVPALRCCSLRRLRLAVQAGFACIFLAVAVPAHAVCAGPAALTAKIKAHPTADAYAELGNWYGSKNQFACAATAFKSAVRLNPKSPVLNYLLGLAYYESKDFNDALPPLRHAIAGDPTVIKPHLLLGSVFTQLNQPQDAASEWAAALKIDSSDTMALHGLSHSLIGMGDYPSDIGLLHNVKLDDDLSLDLAVAYSKTGMQDEAVRTLKAALATSPDSVQLSSALVTVYLKIVQTDLAEQIAEKCYKAHPDDRSAQVSYLRTLVVNGDWAPATPIGNKLLTEDPHSFDTLYMVGVMERQAGDFTAARDHLTEAMALDPSLANLRYNLGVALARLHDIAGALPQLQQAIALGDHDPEAHFELANALRAAGQTDAAKQEMLAYQQAVKDKDNTSLAAAKAAEAELNLTKGDTEKAVQLYRDAFAATPKNALLGYKLAMALDKASNQEDEHAVLEQVIAIDPQIALAQHQLGYLDSRRGDNTAAEKDFRLAVTAAPGYTEAWISLAATLGMESKFPAAQQAVANALLLDPDNSEARQLSHDLTVAQSSPSQSAAPSQSTRPQQPHDE
jgi:tetratricopeptide (TPR) repeat protein